MARDELFAFLRARCDEEDATADNIHDLTCDLVVNADTCTCGIPDRIRRDVEAKRRIVSGSEHAYEHRTEGSTLSGFSLGHTFALHDLAHPYADHPDFSDGWRTPSEIAERDARHTS